MGDSFKALIDEKIEKERTIISINNLKMELFSELGRKFDSDKIQEELSIDKRLLQINSRQFVIKDEVINFMSKDLFNKLLQNNKHEELVDKLSNIIHANFPIFEVKKDIILNCIMNESNFDEEKEKVNKELLSQIVINFEQYYQSNQQAVRTNDYSFKNSYFQKIDCSMEELLEVLTTYPLFYQLTKKRFALTAWILLKLAKKGFFQQKRVEFRNVELAVRDILGSKQVNKSNLLELFAQNKYFKVVDNSKCIEFTGDFDNLQSNLIQLYQKYLNTEALNSVIDFNSKQAAKRKQEKIDFDFEKLKEPKSITKLKKELSIDINNDSLVYLLLSYRDNLYYNDGNLVYKEKATLDDQLQKLAWRYDYIDHYVDDYSLPDLIHGIFKKEERALKVKEIQNHLQAIGIEVELEQIEDVLKQNSDYKCVDYQTWIDSEELPFKHRKYQEFLGDFKEEIDQILNKFGERQAYICRNRTFVTNGETLDEIGDEFGVSRERIRQLENKLLRRINHPNYHSNYRRYFNLLEQVFEDNLVLQLEEFYKHPIVKEVFSNINIRFLVNFYNQCNGSSKDDKLQLLYDKYLLYLTSESYDLLWARVKNELLDEEGIGDFSRIIKFFAKFKIRNQKFLQDVIAESDYMIKAENKVLIKDDNIYSTDRIRLVLSLFGEPVHYEQVQGVHNQYFTEISAHNAHAKLNGYDEFIRVGRGTYGLASWGCKEVVYVRDLNYKVLQQQEAPMHYKKITEKVLDNKEVEEHTVYIYLHSDDRIFNYSWGMFALKEWQDDPEIAAEYDINAWRIQASEQDEISEYFLGSFIGRNDRLASLHQISETYYDRSFLKVSKKVKKRMELKNQIIAVDDQGRIYKLFFDKKFRKIKRIRGLLEDNNISINDYIYIEYYNSKIIKLHSKEEYEENYRAISKDDIMKNKDTVSQELVSEVNKAINRDFAEEKEEIEVIDLESALEYGLKHGSIEFKKLLELDYSNEEISDHFEAIQLFDKKNIEIIYD